MRRLRFIRVLKSPESVPFLHKREGGEALNFFLEGEGEVASSLIAHDG